MDEVIKTYPFNRFQHALKNYDDNNNKSCDRSKSKVKDNVFNQWVDSKEFIMRYVIVLAAMPLSNMMLGCLEVSDKYPLAKFGRSIEHGKNI